MKWCVAYHFGVADWMAIVGLEEALPVWLSWAQLIFIQLSHVIADQVSLEATSELDHGRSAVSWIIDEVMLVFDGW